MASNGCLMACTVCGRTDEQLSGHQRVQWCSSCHATQYCSRDCQKFDWKRHRKDCLPKEKAVLKNYIIRLELRPQESDTSTIVRTLSCPPNATFEELHRALQEAFRYSSDEPFDFSVKEKGHNDCLNNSRPDTTIEAGKSGVRTRDNIIRITEKPKPARSASNSSETFRSPPLSRVLTPQEESDNVELWEVFENPKYNVSGMIYEYEFEDGLDHIITVIGRTDRTEHFSCVAGSSNPFAEKATYGTEKYY
jgi:hypothetical protein